MIETIKKNAIDKVNNNLQEIIVKLYLKLNHNEYCRCDYCNIYKHLPILIRDISFCETKINEIILSDDDYTGLHFYSQILEYSKKEKMKLENIKLS